MPEPLPRLNEARLARRILLHLLHQPRLGPEDTPTRWFTQAGLAEAIVATQGAVAKITRRLVAAGVLDMRRRRVQGSPRRLIVYTLSWKGEDLVAELEGRERTVDLRDRPRLAAAMRRPPVIGTGTSKAAASSPRRDDGDPDAR